MLNQPLHSPINPHFFQPLLPGFTNHLDIPVAFFLKHLGKSNKGKTAQLRSDASETTWKVKIDGRRFSDGWEDFAVAHDLRVGDIVVFRHEGEFVFHVTSLGPSCCEIKYGGYSDDEEDKMEKLCDTTEKVSRKKKSPETETDPSTHHSCFVATVKASNLMRDTVYLPITFAMSNDLMKKFEIILVNEVGESWKIDLRCESYNGRFYMSRGWRSFCVANGKKPGDMFVFKLVQNEETPVLKLFPLNSADLYKREEVPKKKRQKVEADSSPEHASFVAIVTASNLRRDTPLPKMFAVSNGLREKFQIDLMNEKGISWTIDLRHEPNSGRFFMRKGWRSFCVANEKKPGDMVNFKLVRNDETPVLKLFPLKLEPINDTREGLEATEKEFLGIEANRSGERQGSCSKVSDKNYHPSGEPTNKAISEANETTIKEENITTSQNRFVTLTLTLASKLNLPLEFTEGNGINKAGKIKMIDRYGTKWSMSLLLNKNKRGAMSLGKGCKGFCEVNGVKMGESFVLELVWEDTVPILKFCSKC